jgi:hypothetical protein
MPMIPVVRTSAAYRSNSVGRAVTTRRPVGLRVAWDDLPDYLDPSTFDLVICVGNWLCHTQGTAMSRLLVRHSGRFLSSWGLPARDP